MKSVIWRRFGPWNDWKIHSPNYVLCTWVGFVGLGWNGFSTSALKDWVFCCICVFLCHLALLFYSSLFIFIALFSFIYLYFFIIWVFKLALQTLASHLKIFFRIYSILFSPFPFLSIFFLHISCSPDRIYVIYRTKGQNKGLPRTEFV